MNEKVLLKGKFSAAVAWWSMLCYIIAVVDLVICFAVAAATVPSVGIMWALRELVMDITGSLSEQHSLSSSES